MRSLEKKNVPCFSELTRYLQILQEGHMPGVTLWLLLLISLTLQQRYRIIITYIIYGIHI